MTGLLIADLAATAGGHKKQQHPGFKDEPNTPVGLFKKKKSEKIILFSQEIEKNIIADGNQVIFYF